MRTIFITGGFGYIGSVLTRFLLSTGYKVIVYDNLMMGGEHMSDVLDNENFQFIRGDIRDTEKLGSLLGNHLYAVINLAAYVSHQLCESFPVNTVEVNEKAPIDIYKIASAKGVKRFIFVSTCSNYGTTIGDDLSTENDPLNPLSLYAVTKVNAESELLKLSRSSDTILTILRFGTIFGLSPRMRFDLLINEIVLKAISGDELEIYSPHAWRPYLHILDAVSSIELVLSASNDKINNEVFNVLSINLTKYMLISDLETLIPIKYSIVETGSDNRNYKISFTKISDVLNFTPKYNLVDGVKGMISVLNNKLVENPTSSKYTNFASNWSNLDFP